MLFCVQVNFFQVCQVCVEILLEIQQQRTKPFYQQLLKALRDEKHQVEQQGAIFHLCDQTAFSAIGKEHKNLCKK